MAATATILLVDDQERNLDALEAILESSGYVMVRARSADEALLALLKGDFAAIVCDIKMPGIGGIELAQMIKGRKRSQHIPILFLTAHTIEQDEMLRGYGVGAVDYLSKPINPEVLRLKLGVFVELFRKNRALAEEISQRQEAEEALSLAKAELEHRVQERTAELSAANQAAESANRAKDHFLAVLSHELRTPLTPVLASIQELLRRDDTPPDIRDSLDLVHRNVELEARLIDDLLDLTRIARGKMELQVAAVDIHQILEHALRTCDAEFRGKQISVCMKLQAKRVQVVGDRGRLLQVFWNLLKNAAKFTSAGQSVEVITRDTEDQRLQVEVSDTGIGIEPSRLGTIFSAFDQGGSEVTRQYGGLGLGLSIAKALVDLHGGAIAAASAGAGCGARFTVELPANVDLPAMSPSTDTEPTKNLKTPARRHSRRIAMLFVEDHPDTARVMSRLLRADGFDVTTANGVAAALRACDAAPKPFDIVVSDIGLPDGSGLDLMRQLRVRFPDMPAVALSGFGMEDDRLRSSEAGFAAHLTKPVDFDALRATIDQVLLSLSPELCSPAPAT